MMGNDGIGAGTVGGKVGEGPVKRKSVAGALAAYAGGGASLAEIREKVWREVAGGRSGCHILQNKATMIP